ncbi:4-coumarate--CoA ligase 1-like, partial [Hyposmocoma kahamanoa]|uniref:4-coumarate--CoA ligase 1-like n=1 Tax=Hyposmocoma kahamanoa TaxID=1477025 RepID=UPI000E6D721F
PTAYDPSAITLTITPWFHVMGLVGNFCSFTTGRTIVYLPKFDMQTYLMCIEKYKVPQLAVVPPILVALCKLDIKFDLSSVKTIYSGAAPLHKDTLEVLKTKFPATQILQGYGMTEVTLAVTRDTMETAHLAKPGGVGFICAGTIIKIVDPETRKTLGPNQRGELCVRGPSVMKGYIGKDTKDDIDSEGFFKTGDIGYYDDDKYFFIVDRLKELIKYKAYQVPPAEIEALLLQHPGVKDAGVVGVENKEAGEVPLAFVVKQSDSDVTEDDVKKFVAERVSMTT